MLANGGTEHLAGPQGHTHIEEYRVGQIKRGQCNFFRCSKACLPLDGARDLEITWSHV